jgi:hypothetical protein
MVDVKPDFDVDVVDTDVGLDEVGSRRDAVDRPMLFAVSTLQFTLMSNAPRYFARVRTYVAGTEAWCLPTRRTKRTYYRMHCVR